MKKTIFSVMFAIALATVMGSCGNKTAAAGDVDSTAVDTTVVDTVAVDSAVMVCDTLCHE